MIVISFPLKACVVYLNSRQVTPDIWKTALFATSDSGLDLSFQAPPDPHSRENKRRPTGLEKLNPRLAAVYTVVRRHKGMNNMF